MKRKTLHTWLSCVALLLAALMVMTVLAGCKKSKDEPKDTTENNGPVFPEACDNHKGNFICENCGRRMTPNGFFTSMKTTDADEAINVLVENLSVTAKGSLVKIEKAEMSVKLVDNQLTGNGWVKGTITEEGESTPAPLEGAFTLKDGKYSMAATTALDGATDNAEMYASFEMLFLQMNNSVAGMVGEILPKAPAFLNDQLLPALKAIVDAHPELEDVCARIADLFLTVTKTDDGYKIALSFDRLSATADKFNTLKVSELCNLILGEGKFDEIKNDANGIFDKKVSEVLDDLKKEGIDVVALMKMVNSILPADDDGKTVMSEILAQFEDEKFLATTMGTLMLDYINRDTENDTLKMTVEDLKKQVEQVFGAMEKMTVWEFIEDMTKKEDKNQPSGYAAPQTDKTLYDNVKSTLEQYKNNIKFSYNTDVYGKALSATMEMNIALGGTTSSNGGTQVTTAISGKIQLLNKYKSTVDYAKYETRVDASRKELLDDVDKIAKVVEKQIKMDHDGAVVTYNEATGILTAKYTEQDNYLRDEKIDGEYKSIEVSVNNPVELTVDLKAVLMSMSSDACKDLRSIEVYYKATYKNNLKVTAKWKDGTALTAKEIEQYIGSIHVEDGPIYRISLLHDTAKDTYSQNTDNYHDYPDEPDRKTGPNADGWTYEYYVCRKCGRYSRQGHGPSGK